MFLVELLLPLYDNKGAKVPRKTFARVRDELTERFGGVTAFTRAPAEGTWVDAHGDVDRDDIIVCEVMVDTLDRAWWADYRKRLERDLGQDELIIRTTEVQRL